MLFERVAVMPLASDEVHATVRANPAEPGLDGPLGIKLLDVPERFDKRVLHRIVGVVAIALLGFFQLNNARETEKRKRVQKEGELSSRMVELTASGVTTTLFGIPVRASFGPAMRAYRLPIGALVGLSPPATVM